MESESADVTHAVVRFIKELRVRVIEISNIKEFKKEKPDDKNDFIKTLVYAGRYDCNSPYAAIEILYLGSLKEMEHKMNQSTRLKFNKFNLSDINNCDLQDSSDKCNSNDTDLESMSDSKNTDTDDDMSGKEKILNTKRNKIQNKKKDAKKRIDIIQLDREQEKQILKEKFDLLLKKSTADLDSKKQDEVTDREKSAETTNEIDNLRNQLKFLQSEVERLKKKEADCLATCNRHSQLESERLQPSTSTKKFFHISTLENTIMEDEKDVMEPPKKIMRKKLEFKPPQETESLNEHSCDSDINIEKFGKSNTSEDDKMMDNEDVDFDKKDNTLIMKIFQRWSKREANQTIEMVYLGKNISIPLKTWKIIRDRSKSTSIFVKNLARALWGIDKLANRCLAQKESLKKVSNRESPRKILTPEKINTIKQCLRYWLIKYRSDLIIKNDIDLTVNKTRSYLTDEVSYQIKKYKKMQVEQKDDSIDISNLEEDD